jgi:death on curing protein
VTRAANAQWVWIEPKVLLAAHDEQLAEHGGASGVRDAGLFESALARPRHLALYGDLDAAALAAAYGVGLARNHPFIDGNKRVAFIAVELFLLLDGQELVADDAACVLTMLAAATGETSEEHFAAWLRQHTVAATD